MRGLALLVVLATAGCVAGRGPGVTDYPEGAWPITSHFRAMTNPNGSPRPRPHKGVDMPAPAGTPVLAAADGVIEKVTTGHRVGGDMIFQRVRADGRSLQLRYAHLRSILVAEGDAVSAGEMIGTVGNTGDWVSENEAPHLHFAVIGPFGRLDPEGFLRDAAGRAVCAGAQGAAAFVYPVACTRPEGGGPAS